MVKLVKKFSVLFFVLALCLVTCVPAFAYDSAEAKAPYAVGILTSETGEQYTIEGALVSFARTMGTDMDNAVTYRYDLPLSSGSGGSSTVYDYDSGIVSTVYLTIHYTTQNSPTEYLLTKVSGYWDVFDEKASVESAKLSYGCSGRFPSVTTQSKTNVSVTNHFSISTGFKKYVCADTWSVLGANLTVNYLMGTSRRWSFTLENNLFNS